MRVELAGELGFCFGVRRAINMLENLAGERGGVETLGAIVHNQQVLQELSGKGVRVARGVDEIQGDTVVVSAHGVSPQVEAEIQARHIAIIDTTCPFVRRAQLAARKLAGAGFFVIIYGDSDHPEVRAILGWANNQGVAALEPVGLDNLPRRIGILSQTTRVPADFTEFARDIVGSTFTKGSEIRIIDTICHDIRKRQADALELAGLASLMLVIGDRNSANTNRLVKLCSTAARTYLVETAAEIQPSWLEAQARIGVTAGASISEQTINEVITRLEAL